jgi:hypothetical protein
MAQPCKRRNAWLICLALVGVSLIRIRKASCRFLPLAVARWPVSFSSTSTGRLPKLTPCPSLPRRQEPARSARQSSSQPVPGEPQGYGTRALGWERPGRQSAQASNSVQVRGLPKFQCLISTLYNWWLSADHRSLNK